KPRTPPHLYSPSFPTRRSSDLITMSADALELVFTGSAVLGTALLLLSSIGGGMHVRLHLPVRLPHLRLRFLRTTRTDDATAMPVDRKSTRLNSSHEWISYAVFC